jgi:hypothetical protein
LNTNKTTTHKINKANMIAVVNDEILLSSRNFNDYKLLAEKVFNDAMHNNGAKDGGVWELVESLDPVTDSLIRNRNVLVVSKHVSCLIVGYIYICMYIYTDIHMTGRWGISYRWVWRP